MEPIINHFYKGLETDKHVEMRDQDTLLENECFRVIDVDGHGLINTNLLGNDYKEDELGFKITQGFIPVGKSVYNGISFILSFNQTTSEFEIGTFPSPKWNNTGGFEPKYAPLKNYLAANNPLQYQFLYPLDDVSYQNQLQLPGIRNNFRITGANNAPWNIGVRMMSVVTRLNYDNSVNIYFADGENATRVINCGFNVFTGFLTRQCYSDNMFECAINLLNESNKPVRLYEAAGSFNIGYNGQYKCGTNVYYFRYLDENFNPTSYQSCSGSIMIIPSDENTVGNAHALVGGPGDKITNKSVTLKIETGQYGSEVIDTAYKYIEIAYVRTIENNVKEAFRYAARFEVQSLVNEATNNSRDYSEILLTDAEEKFNVSLTEIITPKRADIVGRHLSESESRLWVGKTKTKDYDWKELYDYAITIEALPYSDIVVDKKPHDTGVLPGEVGYKHYRTFYDKAHYMCGEAYALGVQFLMKDSGKWSESFPITSGDYYNDFTTPSSTNTKGIIRMPSQAVYNPFGLTDKDMYVLGLTFNIPTTTTYISDNVSAIRFTRAKRRPNQLYQGLISKVFCSASDPAFGRYGNAQDFTIPTFRFYYPYTFMIIPDPPVPLSPWWANAANVPRGKGPSFVYYANLRSFPSPAVFMPPAEDVDDGREYGTRVISLADWVENYFYESGVNEYGGPYAYTKLRCDVPWRIWVSESDKIVADGMLHWTSISYGMLGGLVSVSSTKPFSGLSYKGDRKAFHRGPGAILPGWNKGKFGIYSLDYAIFPERFKQSSYLVKKLAQFDPVTTEEKDFTDFGVTAPPNTRDSSTIVLRRYLIDVYQWSYVLKPSRSGDSNTIFSGQVYGIRPWDIMPIADFVSYYKEGSGDAYDRGDFDNDNSKDEDDYSTNYIQRTQTDFHFYWWDQKNKKRNKGRGELNIRNLEFGVAPYLGIDFTGLGWEEWPYYWLNDLVGLYMTNPDDPGFDITKWYSPENLDYFPITQHFYKNEFEDTNNIVAFRGDSFPGHGYIKYLTNPQYDPYTRDDSYDSFIAKGEGQCAYGQVLGFYAEHNSVVGLRHPEYPSLNTSPNELDHESFYPALLPHDPANYAIYNRARESYRYNEGYSNQLSELRSAGFNIQIAFRQQEFQGRICFSDRYIENAFVDQWRNIDLGSHKDFSGKGILNGLIGTKERLYSFWTNGVMLHVPSQPTSVATNTGEVVIGQQGEVLSDKAYEITKDYGLQHTQAVGESINYIYFVDALNRAIVQIPKGSAQFDVISIKQGINSLLLSEFDAINHHSDYRYQIPDLPSFGEGIVIGFNKKYKEVYFGYRCKPNRETTLRNTFIFNESIGRFTGTHKIFVPMYITIVEDFYGMEVPELGSSIKRFFIWDREFDSNGNPNACKFFFQTYESYFTSVINKYSSVEKIYDSVELQMNNENAVSVRYETQYQTGLHAPFNQPTTPLYVKPKYRENKFEFPVIRCIVGNDHYQPGSAMRGQNMKVKVSFLTNNRIFVKSITVHVRQSKH